MDYQLIDSGEGRKLERFGNVTLIRPCSQAIWTPEHPEKWKSAQATFSREGSMGWKCCAPLPTAWEVEVAGVRFQLKATDFGHLGIFPEQAAQWRWIQERVKKGTRVLNLFAYSGGSTLAAAKAGAEVTHLDAAKGMVAWARENAELNGLKEAPIRWIVDDARKYLARALRRGEKYDAIILDPPTFGRGSKGEIFKIEEELPLMLEQCRALLSEEPLFLLLSCHTPGYSPLVLKNLLGDAQSEAGEMVLEGTRCVPSGTFARWKP